MADFWIKIRTCSGDGTPTDIVADLARAIRQAADHRPWLVAIAPSAEGLHALDDKMTALDDSPTPPSAPLDEDDESPGSSDSTTTPP